MHEYDTTLKSILTRPGSVLLNALTGERSLRWLNVETPQVVHRRVDLLGEAPGGDLTHIELQSRNEKDFPLRMAEYLLGIRRRYGRFPRQVALYVGEARMRMRNHIEGPGCTFRYHLVDIRSVDSVALLASENIGDNVIAVLTQPGVDAQMVRRILCRIAEAADELREQALAELLIVAGLRRLSAEVTREAEKMPILNDIMDNEVIGPLIRKGLVQGLAEGRLEGRVEGREQGRVEGEMALLCRQIEKKFGDISPRIRRKLNSLRPGDIAVVGLRLLDARTIEDLFA